MLKSSGTDSNISKHVKRNKVLDEVNSSVIRNNDFKKDFWSLGLVGIQNVQKECTTHCHEIEVSPERLSLGETAQMWMTVNHCALRISDFKVFKVQLEYFIHVILFLYQ